MTDSVKLDDELRRVLEAAGVRSPVLVEPQQLKLAQSSPWPWQVPQAPVYTSDRAPTPN